jgi:hypothetical protein
MVNIMSNVALYNNNRALKHTDRCIIEGRSIC